jgi:gp16 family phage-associated protein
VTPNQVKALFKKQGKTFTEWAQEHGYSRNAVYRVLNGFDHGNYGKAHEIANKLGINHDAVDEPSVAFDQTHSPLTKRKIMSLLVEQGSSLRQFALQNGYNERYVLKAVDRWAGQRELPRGRLTIDILKKLSNAVGGDVVEGIREAA